jgi:hypothetical protein
MKTRKRDLIVVLALLVSGALMMGCPPPNNPTTPTTPPDENQEYDIVLWIPPVNGDVDISPRRAARGATITITLKPDAGFEPENLRVFNTSNYSIPHTGSGNTYTFVMVSSLVRVSVEFIELDNAISNANRRLSVTSSWDQIDALNTLLNKSPSQTAGVALTAINTLKGVLKTGDWTAPTDPPNDLSEKWTTLGIIRSKMRNSEDLTKWISLTWPSDPIKMGADIKDSLESDTLGTDRTILYYVKEDNSTPLPVPVLGKGWQAGTIYPLTDAMCDNIIKDTLKKFDVVQEIPLVYKVGTDPKNSVDYKMMLWPVAQYTVQYDPGTSGNVTIQEYWYDTTKTKKDSTDIDDCNKVADLLTLNSRNLQGTGYVGRATTGTTDNSKEVFVKITPSQPNVYVAVYTSSGNLVRDILTETLRTDISSTSPGYFYPESVQYTIRVRSTTPPAPFN